ncbi:hypothetical protein ACFVW1_14355 [Streptomyces olivochromogenes]|uniref:hypothetical protein n=1 Tax=Streptomyces olivochromogenes TaxID=1963 RepID=UPI0036D871DF
MLYVITGLSPAGKSSRIKAHARADDIVIDLDLMALAMAGPGADHHAHGEVLMRAVHRSPLRCPQRGVPALREGRPYRRPKRCPVCDGWWFVSEVTGGNRKRVDALYWGRPPCAAQWLGHRDGFHGRTLGARTDQAPFVFAAGAAANTTPVDDDQAVGLREAHQHRLPDIIYRLGGLKRWARNQSRAPSGQRPHLKTARCCQCRLACWRSN